MVASYIGITPEALSRVQNEIPLGHKKARISIASGLSINSFLLVIFRIYPLA